MRILHVITGLGVGGAEHQLRLLLRHLPYRHEVVSLTPGGAVADAIRADGTPVHVVPMRGNRDLSAVPRLIGLMRRGRFDAVHTHLYRACVYGRLAARAAGIRRVVATEHSLGDGLIEGRRTTAGVRALYLASERIGGVTIAVSSTVAGRLLDWGVRPDRLHIVPNGIDAAELAYDPALRRAARDRLGIAPGARVVGSVGRFAPTKRFDVLIRALPAVPGATLLLIGDGPARADLQRLVHDLGLDGRVVFAGARPHARELLCAMDVFASPSQHETFGMAVLEALASGLPTLYTACPPLEELPAAAAPGARRLPADPDAYARALRDLTGQPDAYARALRDLTGQRTDLGEPRRLPVPPAVAHYDVAHLAASVAALYHPAAETAPAESRRS
jgi:glycosyltransferase involved in cell wall biosynthesis